jgi:hypothetical protein
MMRLHRLAVLVYTGLSWVLPGEFRRRYRAEMQFDFADEMNLCVTAVEIGVTAARAYRDLVVSAVREWWSSEGLRLLMYAGVAHAGIWLLGVGVAAWQWPGGSRLYPVVVTFAVLSAPGIAVAVWRQRLRINRAGCCSLVVAELD